MQIVIDISEEQYNTIKSDLYNTFPAEMKKWGLEAIRNSTPLPKGHSFIAICDSDFPITEEVRQELKNTVFVGNEDCNYCFDMTEIIEADTESEDKDDNN